MSVRLPIVILACLAASGVTAQEAPTAQSEAMRKLDFLVGRWEGNGSVEFGPGQRREFKGTETVQSKAGGLLLTIEGIHRGKLGGQGEEVVIHDAFGLISFDAKAKQYRFEAFTARGNREETVARVEDGKLTWGMTIPQFGDTRYTITLDEKGRWSEIGEVTRDGKEWRKFFEMTMTRAK